MDLHMDRESADTGEAADCLCLRWGSHQGPPGQEGTGQDQDTQGHRKCCPRSSQSCGPSQSYALQGGGRDRCRTTQDHLWVSLSTMRQRHYCHLRLR